MSGSSSRLDHHRDHPGRAHVAASVWAALALIGFLVVVQVAQAIHIHFVHGTPFHDEIDPARSLSRIVFVAVILAMTFPFATLIARQDSGLAWLRDLARRCLLAAGGRPWLFLALFALTGAAVEAIRAFPNSGDEYNYLFQAETFLSGRLWVPVPDEHTYFKFSHIFMQDGKWVSQYAPGWAAILAVGHLAGLPYWLIDPLLGLVSLVAVFVVARQRAGRAAAVAAVLLFGLTAFFLFNAASYFPHLACGLFGLVFCAAAERFRRQPTAVSALAMGLSLGMIGLIRPFDAVLFLLPHAAATLPRLRLAHLTRSWIVIAGGLPFIAATLYYNWSISGDPLLPVTNWGYPTYRLGINPTDEAGRHFTYVETAHHALTRLYMLAEWTSPIFLVLYGSALTHLWRRRQLRPTDFIIVVFLAGYLLAPGLGGNEYGPRYYFPAFPMMVLTCSTAIGDWVGVLWERRESRFALGLFLAHVVVASAAIVPIGVAMHRIVAERMDIYDLAADQGLTNAVVILGAPTGALHPMGPLDLTRNGIQTTGPVIYMLAWPGWQDAVRRLFPTRQVFFYTRERSAPKGRLAPIALP